MNLEVKNINGYDVKDIKAIRTYDTVALMKADRKLKQGQHVKTRGYYSINDGGSAEYYIVNEVSENDYKENLENGLYGKLIIENNTVNFYQLGLVDNTYLDEDFSISGLTFDLLGNTFTAKSYSFNNCKVYNGKIISNNPWSINVYNDITFENLTIENENNTGDPVNNVMITMFDNNNDNVIIKDCTFKNYGFGVEECKNIEVRNNLFYYTLDTATSIIQSKESIHVTNSQFLLENCIIEGNVFKDMKNDCIDVYPTGENIVIKNNTFYRCYKGIELKAENRDPDDPSVHDRTVKAMHACLVQGNYFREIPNDINTTCITCYCNDDTEQNDYTLYPHIIIDSCFFCNDNGYTVPRIIRLQNINNIQISNCRSNHRGENSLNYFVYSVNSNCVISNCILDNDIINCPNGDGIAYISNCIGRNIRGVRRLVMSNTQFNRFNLPNDLTNLYYSLDNVICPNQNFDFTGGLYQISNSKFHSILNSYTEDSSKTETDYACLVNCFYDTGTIGTNNANFNAINCNKISSSANLFISNLN